MSTNKFNLFLENARILSDKLGIVPLLYGSLGLEYLTGDDLGADDIDILVPRVFTKERWCEFKVLLEVQATKEVAEIQQVMAIKALLTATVMLVK